MFKPLGVVLFFSLMTTKLWAPSYTYTIRDSEFDYYDTDAYATTLKLLSSKAKTLDVFVADRHPKPQYFSVKPHSSKPLTSKKLIKDIIEPKFKVHIGNERQEPLKELKLKTTSNFVTKEFEVSADDCLKELVKMSDNEYQSAHFKEQKDGTCLLVLAKGSFFQTWRLEVPVEIVD